MSKIILRVSCLKMTAVVGVFLVVFFISYNASIQNFVSNFGGPDSESDEFLAQLNYDDQRLIDHIRKHYLHPPPQLSRDGNNDSYNLESPNERDYSQMKQSTLVEEILGKKTNGFFVECGAFDGEKYSNTLMFEKYLNWTGLLVEPSPKAFKTLRTKNRKAWTINACLESGQKPKKRYFYEVGELSEILEKRDQRLESAVKGKPVWCFPLYSLLAAVNQQKVDYFSLDTEGSELEILKTLPVDKIYVGLLQVEHSAHWKRLKNKHLALLYKQELMKIVAQKLPSYTFLYALDLDLIYIRDGYLD